jgi:hypothetical protein
MKSSRAMVIAGESGPVSRRLVQRNSSYIKKRIRAKIQMGTRIFALILFFTGNLRRVILDKHGQFTFYIF